MTRNEFMAVLRGRLAHLPKEEQDAALKYYEEYFDEAASEEEAARQLGSPETIAERILSEYPASAQPQPESPKHSPGFWVGITVLCVFASPLLLSLAAVALALALSAAAVVLSLIAAVVSPALVLSVTFTAMFFFCLYLSLGALGIFPAGAVLLAGLAFLFGALGILSGIFMGYLCYWIGLMFSKLFKGHSRRKGADKA